jgi:hypothetical protein
MKTDLKKYLPELIFAIPFIALSVVLNSQFLDGSNINTIIAGHDEYIAVKEIYSILEPASLKHWFMAIISGNALYYGRILFYFDALIAAIPYWLFGIKGMVFTVRLLHASILLLAVIVLSRTFLEKSFHRLLFLIGSSALYYSLYFVMMPKPEPHQLLCLAWFLNRFKKNDWHFTWHFIFLGIAYGLKFNILLLLPLFFIVPLLKVGFNNSRTILLPGIKAFGFFIIGILIAVPCLILTPIKPVFLKAYLHETFGGTEKLYDNASLGVYDWLTQGLGGAYLGWTVMAVPFVLFVTYQIVISVKRDLKQKNYAISIVLLSGAILTAVIMLKTKRLWPHYLWTGYVLMLLGTIASVSRSEGKRIKTFQWTFLSIFLGVSFYFFLVRELPLFLNLSNRNEISTAHQWSQQAINYVKKKYPSCRVGTDGSVLYPFEDFVGVDLYHPFAGKLEDRAKTRFYWYTDFPEKIWEENNQVLIFYKRNPKTMYIMHPNVYVGRHDELYQLYLKNVGVNYELDTSFGSFGEVMVYKQIKK